MSDTLHCIAGPAGIPPEVASKLEAAFAKGMETPEYKVVMERIYVSPAHLSGKEFDQSLKERWTRMDRLFKEYGIIKEAATQPY